MLKPFFQLVFTRNFVFSIKIKILNNKYPFDPSIKHHIIIALGLAIWIFVFLFFTEPFDVNELTNSDKLLYLSGYGLLGGLYTLVLYPNVRQYQLEYLKTCANFHHHRK